MSNNSLTGKLKNWDITIEGVIYTVTAASFEEAVYLAKERHRWG